MNLIMYILLSFCIVLKEYVIYCICLKTPNACLVFSDHVTGDNEFHVSLMCLLDTLATDIMVS